LPPGCGGTEAGSIAAAGRSAARPGPVNHLRPIWHLGAVEFRGKKWSVSDLLACDPHKSIMTELSTRKRFGVVADEQQRALSGIEFVQGLADGTLPLNSMAQTLGYDIIKVAKGHVVAAVEPHAGHLNPSGTVHGGLAATLLDSAMGLAIRTMLEKGFAQTTLEFKISMVRPITPHTGLVKAEGKVISCGRRIGTAEGTVRDTNGRVLAHGTTTCLIFEL
jgi:uncharacterized protein (TIGR00369 family)